MVNLAVAGKPAQAEQFVVFAAASLKTALDEIASAFDGDTEHNAVLSYAGSSLLARQIAAGAPADLYISANTDWMDHLSDRGFIRASTRRNIAGNSLVLIASAPDAGATDLTLPDKLRAYLGKERLAMALADAVPAGLYAKAALTHLGLWEELQPQIVQTDNVRTALALVSRGETPFGIVYASDARADPAVLTVGTFPEDAHPRILYPAAQVTGSNSDAARVFLDYLEQPAARKILSEQGFLLIEE